MKQIQKKRNKVREFVESFSGKYEAPDGMVSQTSVASADFKTEEEALIFATELSYKGVSWTKNFISFPKKRIYFQENILMETFII